MDETKKNISFNKSGTGGITPKLNLVKEWLDDMGVSEAEREVILNYDRQQKEIKIKKK